jgi:pimeloyl-ACP methyl ester carboxylesterase
MSNTSATLHDRSTLPISTTGSGPALLLPVRTEPRDPADAESMRAWGADPDLGASLVHALSGDFRVIAADYEGHRLSQPAVGGLTPETITADLLAIVDAAAASQFAYYGYSWLALAGMQLALRTDRVSALAMGGFPPIDGPYRAMLAVTRAADDKARRPQDPPTEPVTPGDWDAAGITVGSAVTSQFVTLYEELQSFDDRTAQQNLRMPRLAFAGAADSIVYGPEWGDTTVDIAGPLRRHRNELVEWGWTVTLLPGLDHMGAMHSAQVLPILLGWLRDQRFG